MNEVERLDKRIERVERADEIVNWLIRIVMLSILALVISFLYDTYAPDDKLAAYHKGDTWIVMEGTNIDYPIVQGKDNFEYLDTDPNGNFYAGGSIFLDYRNSYDFSDEYSTIYGHNMAGGKMFSDLKKYYNADFFEEHSTGMLFTPDRNYMLTVIGILNANAYDNAFGVTEVTAEVLQAISGCAPLRDINVREKQILALSTCSTSMDDRRDVVFCTMEETDAEYLATDD